MKHTNTIFRVMIVIWSMVSIFYPNKYTYGIWTLLILIQITVQLIKKPKKSTMYFYIFLAFLDIALYLFYIVKKYYIIIVYYEFLFFKKFHIHAFYII
ncbi:hypothetical protein VT91_31330 [Clostridium sporogenes]|nr:hypothetical protein WG71_34750 [Clostridium sporogenes]KRU26191.1 hypothetical protein VT91_31330 [Clostridium sporogenes]KRU27247.1 hypothetical protein VT28_27590 [Clostridium sporogenes]KRU49107.1 hypothetical protein VT95_04890 [Clostridium sporogenes]OQP90753.1 hypothetical protein VT92_0212240 [Clostridium sporogenes]